VGVRGSRIKDVTVTSRFGVDVDLAVERVVHLLVVLSDRGVNLEEQESVSAQ